MIVRLCIGIPTFNNESSIDSVVESCLRETRHPILVLDDGSEVPVMCLFRSGINRQALASGRLRVLRWEKNRGKGYAIQEAFRYCVKEGFTHLLTIDADGQHLASQVPKLVQEALKDPWALVIGYRELPCDNVPGTTRFGRNFSNFWVKYETGNRSTDSQSGFRIYPIFLVQSLKFWCARYDFEIEVLIRLIWGEVPVREVSIAVYYPPQAERVTHFNKFSDNLRISLLNAALVTISLLRLHLRPKEVGWAIGTGVAIGCTPFFGFHTLLVALASLAFKLNVGVMWLGSQVSIPPFAPILMASSLYVGFQLNQIPFPSSLSEVTFEFAAKSYFSWILGSTFVGLFLGSLIGGVSYILSRKLQTRKNNWTGTMRGGRLGPYFLKKILQLFGLRAAYSCLLFIVPYFYVFAPRARRGSIEYWSTLYPDVSHFPRFILVLKHFYKFGTLLLDRIFQSQFAEARFTIRSNGFHHVEEALRQGKGAILLGAHVGGWDIAASYLHTHGVDFKFHLAEYEATGVTLNKLKEQKGGVEEIFINQMDQPVFAIHTLLNSGAPVALMGDRSWARQCELVRFFGKLAPFDVTAFRVAASTRVPVVISFGFKGAGGGYEFFALAPKQYEYVSSVSREIQRATWAQEFAEMLENFIRRYPDQWFNFYPFWSSVPSSPQRVLSKKEAHSLSEDLSVSVEHLLAPLDKSKQGSLPQ